MPWVRRDSGPRYESEEGQEGNPGATVSEQREKQPERAKVLRNCRDVEPLQAEREILQGSRSQCDVHAKQLQLKWEPQKLAHRLGGRARHLTP